MANENGVKVQPNSVVLDEVSFDHLTDSEKKVLLDAGFEEAQILIDDRDPKIRRNAEVELAERYLKGPV